MFPPLCFVDGTKEAVDSTKIVNTLENDNIEEIREELLKFPGVGAKVADCIMLFSMKKYQVFPIDVWVKRVMSELYFDGGTKNTENKNSSLSNKKILELAYNKYGDISGLAQQYLFYWRREL